MELKSLVGERGETWLSLYLSVIRVISNAKRGGRPTQGIACYPRASTWSLTPKWSSVQPFSSGISHLGYRGNRSCFWTLVEAESGGFWRVWSDHLEGQRAMISFCLLPIGKNMLFSKCLQTGQTNKHTNKTIFQQNKVIQFLGPGATLQRSTQDAAGRGHSEWQGGPDPKGRGIELMPQGRHSLRTAGSKYSSGGMERQEGGEDKCVPSRMSPFVGELKCIHWSSRR